MLGSKPSQFPMEQNHQLALAKGPPSSDPSKHKRLVGRLIYLTIMMQKLIYYVHILTQFMQTPLQDYWDAAMRVLRYLKSSSSQSMVLPKDNDLKLLVDFCDSDRALCPITRKSISEYLIKLGNAPISSKTKKQVIISRSSSEAEYHAMTHATSEIIWLRSLLSNLQVPCMNPPCYTVTIKQQFI